MDLGKDSEDFHYFSEWVEYRDNDEKLEAQIYLNSWKKFYLRKLSPLVFEDEHIIDRPSSDFLGSINTLGIKIKMKGRLPENIVEK